jgi:biopolymer transport protein ExbD
LETAAPRKRGAAFFFLLLTSDFRLRQPARDKTIFIAGAPSLRYKAIIGVLDAAKGAGVDRVGIITEGMRRATNGR